MAKNPVEVWLWLLLVMQPFNSRTHYILEQCGGDAAEAGRNIRDGKYDFLSDAEKRSAESVRMKDVRELMETCSKNEIRIITLDDDEYPQLLRGIENPPIVLFCAGSLAGLNNTVTLSVVGARNVSDYGVNVTHRIVEPLAALDIAIISGVAVGTDAEAHRACLAKHGRTIGVLGCGILVNYPAENAELKREIIANGGALISELLPHTRTFAAYFNTRNRIIAGLSLGTLIIEAGERSGALLTARHAVEQDRDLFCIPPRDLFSSRYNGVIPFLRKGAVAVYSFNDILDEYAMFFSNEKYVRDTISRHENTAHERKTPRKPRGKAKSLSANNIEIAEEKTEAPLITEELLSSLEPRETDVLKLLMKSPDKADALMEQSGLEYGELSETLTDLEIAGYIERGQDGVYSVKQG